MTEGERLAERFEQERPRLREVAYRMLGSVADADEAVQDAWIRLSRSHASWTASSASTTEPSMR